MTPKKTVYYTDPLNDDFAGTKIKQKKVGGDFKFIRRGLVWNIFSAVLYYLVAVPIVFVYTKIVMGLKIENGRALREIRKKGYFLYGNHTQRLDPFIPPMVSFPKKAYTVANPDAVSIPFLKNIVMMLGGLPLPTDFAGMQKFISAVETRNKRKNAIAIYPEAHVWPFYTGIRPFSSASFRYPAKLGAPVVAMVATYRRRHGLFALLGRPGVTVTLSDPIYPEAGGNIRAAQEELRRQVYTFMVRVSQEKENVEYIRYEQVVEEEGAETAEAGT